MILSDQDKIILKEDYMRIVQEIAQEIAELSVKFIDKFDGYDTIPCGHQGLYMFPLSVIKESARRVFEANEKACAKATAEFMVQVLMNRPTQGDMC